ncbi:EexN family lipoprotein [Phyllobacterium sp. SB3]|uniref:EexN family lipoprotein n=1 Tax=Phyllobacterium sp. SB3 TaxID=3156073 RepID=UPI0032B0009A
MKRAIFAVIALALSACSGEAEKTYTVDELMADDALLTKLLGKCRNNPGELQGTTNCINAQAADGKMRLERMRKSFGG